MRGWEGMGVGKGKRGDRAETPVAPVSCFVPTKPILSPQYHSNSTAFRYSTQGYYVFHVTATVQASHVTHSSIMYNLREMSIFSRAISCTLYNAACKLAHLILNNDDWCFRQ